jgi:hypothetical protein
LVFNKRLTNAGFEAIVAYIANLIAGEQKAALNMLVNRLNASNLVVDSGEITARLEISNLYAADEAPGKNTIARAEAKVARSSIEKGKSFMEEVNRAVDTSRIKVTEFKDEKTGKTTVLIDKSSLDPASVVGSQIPNVRLSVQPAKRSGNSEIYSEIKIKFKTT